MVVCQAAAGRQFGHDGNYGLRCFSRVLEHYKSDTPLCHKFMQFCEVCVRCGLLFLYSI